LSDGLLASLSRPSLSTMWRGLAGSTPSTPATPFQFIDSIEF